MDKTIVVVKVVDQSDFDKVVSTAAFTSEHDARDYAQVMLALAKHKVDPEWRDCLAVEYETIVLIS